MKKIKKKSSRHFYQFRLKTDKKVFMMLVAGILLYAGITLATNINRSSSGHQPEIYVQDPCNRCSREKEKCKQKCLKDCGGRGACYKMCRNGCKSEYQHCQDQNCQKGGVSYQCDDNNRGCLQGSSEPCKNTGQGSKKRICEPDGSGSTCWVTWYYEGYNCVGSSNDLPPDELGEHSQCRQRVPCADGEYCDDKNCLGYDGLFCGNDGFTHKDCSVCSDPGCPGQTEPAVSETPKTVVNPGRQSLPAPANVSYCGSNIQNCILANNGQCSEDKPKLCKNLTTKALQCCSQEDIDNANEACHSYCHSQDYISGFDYNGRCAGIRVGDCCCLSAS